MLRLIRVFQLWDNWVYVCYCPLEHYPIVKAALVEQNYNNIQPLIWYKENQNTIPGGTELFTWAFEVMVVAFMGPQRTSARNLPKSPLERHNVIVGPQITDKYKADGQPLNNHEKPAWISRLLCTLVVPPGGNVIVLGAGAGGDVIGALAYGASVVACEVDQRQFTHLRARLEDLVLLYGDYGTWQEAFPFAFTGSLGNPRPVDEAALRKVHRKGTPKAGEGEPEAAPAEQPAEEEASQRSNLCAGCEAEGTRHCVMCGMGFCEQHGVVIDGKVFCPMHSRQLSASQN